MPRKSKPKEQVETTSLILKTKPSFIVPAKKHVSSHPLNKWIKEQRHSYQVTRKDVCYIYRNIIFAKTVGELKEILDNEEKRNSYPALVIAIIAGVLGDIARGHILNLTRILQFVFPDAMKGFDPEEFANKAGQGGYDEIKDLEDALKRLEGEDSILIVDKLITDAEYKIVEAVT
jgi:hypothetical protein